MTLDLGFAPLRFADGTEAGIVDVPGHERFLHNMLAGAAGMELLLLVVDANEGVRAQTLEHLAILQFLNVRRVIVVVSKIDLLDEDRRAEALQRIAQQLRATIAEEAPAIGVSAATGENVAVLRDQLHRELAALPAPNSHAPLYLPIDRVFTLAGLGTVVTGTLMQGAISAGDTIKIEPGATAAHVRSIEVFGSKRKRVEAGARVALNLPGLDGGAVMRGHAVVSQVLHAQDRLAVHFVPIAGATMPLRRKIPVRAYIGSAEVLGTLTFDASGASARQMRAQLLLRESVVAFPGLRFVVRRPSPMTLIGGGFVETSDGAADRGELDGDDLVAGLLREGALNPVDVQTIAAAVNLREELAREALDHLKETARAIAVSRPLAYVDAGAANDLLMRVAEHLDTLHRTEPWTSGATSLALSRALGVDESTLVRILEHFVREGRIARRAGYYAQNEHRPRLTLEQHGFFERLIPFGTSNTFAPVAFGDVASAVKTSKIAGLSKAFDTLLASRELVKVGDDLYRASQIADIRARVEAYLRTDRQMTAAQFRDLLGTSRKHAVPLLEWLDARGVTVRNGDYRALRKQSS